MKKPGQARPFPSVYTPWHPEAPLQVWEGLLITAADQLTICGYNFKTGIKKTFSADISEKGSIVLNAKIFNDIVRKLPDDIIEIDCDEHCMTTIRCGMSEFNILGASPEEFPEPPNVEESISIHLSCDLLRSMIDHTGLRRFRQRKQADPHRIFVRDPA